MQKIILTVLTSIFIGLSAQAQMSSLLYNSKHIPQVNAMNPAFFVNDKMYVAFPNLNLNFDFPLSFNDVFLVQTTDNGENITLLNTDGILEALERKNEIGLDLNIGIMGSGFKTKHGFLTIGTQLKNNFQLGLPKDVLRFIADGNVDENGYGRTLTLIDQDLLSLNSYFEVAVGYGRTFGKNLTIGVRAKALLGLLNITTTDTRIDLETDPNLNSLGVNMDYHVRMSLPVPTAAIFDSDNFELNLNSTADMMNLIPRNWGMAFDIGAKYQLNKNLSVAVSLLDLGAIHWQSNIVELKPENGGAHFTFEGLSWDHLIVDGQYNGEFFSTMADSIITEFTQYQIDTNASGYWEAVPWKVNLSGPYDLNKILSANLMYRGEKNKFNYFQSVTAGININLWNWLEIMACNSIHNFNDFLNPGVGFSMSLLSAVQVYTLFDYVSDIYIVDGKSFRFFFGLNIVI